MRILYAAIDQTVPGTLGGSVHVQSTAEGLAALGHEVHVAARLREPLASLAAPPGKPGAASPERSRRVTWHALSPLFGMPMLRWQRTAAIAALARRVGAELIMERYYNFGGEGVFAANRLDVPSVLEVNAPIVDYPGSAKAGIDRALLIQPMRRWRERICRLVSLFVTPTAAILPPWVDRAKVLEIEWGADTDAFRPRSEMPGVEAVFARDPNRIWCVFAGAFRPWHGAARLTEALAWLHAAGDRRFGLVLIGDGPERAAAERAAANIPSVIFTGPIPHTRLPAYLAACDIGVAPFEPERHPPLALGFFWSPLKVFEYMASGLPVVAPRIPRLSGLIEHGREGWLYDPREAGGLAQALGALADPALRHQLGSAARERAVREFSWKAHCEALSRRMESLVPRRSG